MTVTVLQGDCLSILPTLDADSINCVVTSPPYFNLRDYQMPPTDWPEITFTPMPGLPAVTVPEMSCCLGLEPDPVAYVGHLVLVFREVRRALREDGVCFLNLGDSYAGGKAGNTNGGISNGLKRNQRIESSRIKSIMKQKKDMESMSFRKIRQDYLDSKDLIGIPWRTAFALQADGWTLRQDVIWAKANPMPESVKDRCTKAHEYVFLLAKSGRYWWDSEAMKEPAKYPEGPGNKRHSYATDSLSGGGLLKIGPRETRNQRSVWTFTSQPFSESHFATMPPALAERCILAGCPPGGVTLDPFGGAGTTGLVADRLQRNAILIELNPAYAAMAGNRIRDDAPLFADVADVPA